MESISMWRATYTPGRWVVLSGPASLVIMRPAPPSMSGLLNALWDDVVSAASVQQLAQTLASFRIDGMPSFAAFFWAADGMHSLVRGLTASTAWFARIRSRPSGPRRCGSATSRPSRCWRTTLMRWFEPARTAASESSWPR